MPYETKARFTAGAAWRFFVGAASTALMGGVMKNVGLVPTEHLGKGITAASTYAMGLKLEMLHDLIGQKEKNQLQEAAQKLGISYPEAVTIRRTAQELSDLVRLDQDSFYKRYDKRFVGSRALAKHYNISVSIADKLLDKRHWTAKGAESVFMNFIIPAAAAGAVGWFLPIPAAWVSAYPTASALLEGVAGFAVGETVRETYTLARREGLFSGPCASSGDYRPVGDDSDDEEAQAGSAPGSSS